MKKLSTEHIDTRVPIRNFGCHQGDYVLVSKWSPEREHVQAGAEPAQAWHGPMWPIALLVQHVMRR